MASKILPMGTMLVGFFGAISFSVPIIAIMTSPSLRRQAMFRTITNLALCETWFLICGGVLGTVNVIGVKLTPVACAVFQSHNLSIGIGSSAALVVVSVERYYWSQDKGPGGLALLTPRRLWLLLLAPWLVMGVSWVTFSTLAAGLMVETFGHSPLHCRFLDVMPPPLKLAATGSATVICVLIVVLNGVISRVAVRHQQAISSQLQLVGRDTEENVSAYWGVLRVTAIYVLFQTPANLSFLLELVWKEQPPVAIGLSSVLVVLVYALDGWFFGYFNSKLRARYAKLFGCRLREHGGGWGEGSNSDRGRSRVVPDVSTYVDFGRSAVACLHCNGPSAASGVVRKLVRPDSLSSLGCLHADSLGAAAGVVRKQIRLVSLFSPASSGNHLILLHLADDTATAHRDSELMLEITAHDRYITHRHVQFRWNGELVRSCDVS
ncbi:hypothetical protein FJT64_009732 [Amphibalanus amphitrite]|uniref:G-protein coupled receptors family 1 profile domain-containing protein n=1 Tax=Amphibalanus amphitrite TaxID=1232801 RepID=A0A6A4V7M1_AMPAM|nr:hypothetical protein FJT64_009732 [Amphibalanus amphitrite]